MTPEDAQQLIDKLQNIEIILGLIAGVGIWAGFALWCIAIFGVRIKNGSTKGEQSE